MNEDAAPITVDLRTRVSGTSRHPTSSLPTIDRLQSRLRPKGTLTGGVTNGTYTFDSADDFNGTATFTFYVTDRGDPDECSSVSTSCSAVLDSDTKTISITVAPVNDTPTAASFSVNTNEDTAALMVDFAANVSDVETGDGALTYTIVSGPSHGILTGTGGSRTYTPTANYNGRPSIIMDSVTDRGDPDNCSTAPCDAAETSTTETVSITVAPVNDAPVIDETNTKFAFKARWDVAARTHRSPSSTAMRTLADSTPDSHTVTIAWGDGSPNTVITNASSGLTRTHTYGAAGVYTATITVTDSHGVSDTTTDILTTPTSTSLEMPSNSLSTRSRHNQVPSIFKHGSTIPLKLEVTDSNRQSTRPTWSIKTLLDKRCLAVCRRVSWRRSRPTAPNTGNVMRVVEILLHVQLEH